MQPTHQVQRNENAIECLGNVRANEAPAITLGIEVLEDRIAPAFLSLGGFGGFPVPGPPSIDECCP